MDEQRVPTWRLREELRRRADEIIEGRAGFERHVGRLSTKPLERIDLDPREVLQILDDADEREREAWAAGAEAGFETQAPYDLPAVLARNPYRKKDGK